MLVLVLNVLSPEYLAVMEWVFTANVLVLKVAVRPVSAAVPMDVPPSKNSTEPVGVPAPGASTATVAVNVTSCPNTDGVGVPDTVVVVDAFSTTCVVDPVLVAKLASPEYTAEMLCDATESVDHLVSPEDAVRIAMARQ